MRPVFFPQNSEADLTIRQEQIAQEYGIYNENMLASMFFFMSDRVKVIRDNKAKAIENKQIYIGG